MDGGCAPADADAYEDHLNRATLPSLRETTGYEGVKQRDEARERLLAHGFGADIALTQGLSPAGLSDAEDEKSVDLQPVSEVGRTERCANSPLTGLTLSLK